jgi:hypothetical protein
VVRILAAAVAGLAFVPAATAISGAQQISADPFATTIGQHETAVEPDSFSFGRTVVSVFQLGRILDGGATANGWATSNDGGTTWRSGVLPALTVHQRPAGPYSRVSDPVIAYDRAHGVWLASSLALRDTAADRLSSVVVSRSPDGVSWSAPVIVAPEIERFNHDKEWLVCDNGAASPNAGRCYAVWTTNPGRTGVLALAVSSDGGLTWSAPTVFDRAQGSGWQPLVRPDGALVVVYEGTAEIAAVVSRDGGRRFTSPVRVAALRATRVPGLRAPPLPSAEIDAAGRVFVAWQDCRFRAGCASNDIVLASSANGVRWSRVQRVPTWPELDGMTHFVPGLGVDASTQESRLGLAFYALTPRGCSADCQVAPMYVSSADGGRTWSSPQPLAAASPVDAFPLSTSGRFLGDYISTSFVDGGAAVPVFASAASPFDGRFQQGVFAVRVPPLASRGRLLRLGSATVSPRAPRVGQRVSVTVRVIGPSKATGVRCYWAVEERSRQGPKVELRQLATRISGNRVTCRWLVRAAKPGTTIRGPLQVLSPEEEATRMFSFRVRK